MQPDSYSALVVEEIAPSSYAREIRSKKITQLPPGDLLIRVHYSSLNYNGS